MPIPVTRAPSSMSNIYPKDKKYKVKRKMSCKRGRGILHLYSIYKQFSMLKQFKKQIVTIAAFNHYMILKFGS